MIKYFTTLSPLASYLWGLFAAAAYLAGAYWLTWRWGADRVWTDEAE